LERIANLEKAGGADVKTYPSYKDSDIEWLGEIPEHWNVKRFKSLCKLKNKEGQGDNYQKKVALENIESWTGRFIETDSEYEGTGTPFDPENVLFGKLRPYLAKVWLSSFSGLAIGDIYVFESNSESSPKFIFYRLLSKTFIDVIDGSSFGAKMPRADWDTIQNLPVPSPSMEEQQAIASFLDQKTAKIDNLVSIKKQQIELLKEERTGIINQAVTKGLNPKAKMKDSGIEWLGEIPEHWEMRKVSRSFSLIGSGTTPKSDEISYYENGDINWIITGDLNDGLLLESSRKVTSKALEDYSTLKIYPRGTLLIAMYGATIGKVSIIEIEGCTNQACCALYGGDLILNKFAYYWFIANKPNVISLGYGGGQPNISQDLIRNLKISTPPVSEQHTILDYLDSQTTKIDKSISDAEKQIDFLKEYRTALISEAVTGKIDVRDSR
jgi:type I restriction enzyme S subunit